MHNSFNLPAKIECHYFPLSIYLIIIKATHFPTKLLNHALEVYQKEVTFFHKNTVAGNEILPALTEMRKLSYIINNTYRIKLRKPIQISISQLCRSGSVFLLLCGPSLKETIFGNFPLYYNPMYRYLHLQMLYEKKKAKFVVDYIQPCSSNKMGY